MTFASMRLPEPYSQKLFSAAGGGTVPHLDTPDRRRVLGLEIWDGILEMHIYVLRTYNANTCMRIPQVAIDVASSLIPPAAHPSGSSAGDWIRHGSGRGRRVRGHRFLQGFSPGFIKAPVSVREDTFPLYSRRRGFFILERSRPRYTREGARLYCPSDPVLAAQYLLAVSRIADCCRLVVGPGTTV